MSEQTPAAFTVPADPTSAFSAMLDFLAPTADPATDEASVAAAAGAGVGTGQQPATAEGTGTAGAVVPAPVAGDAGKPAVPADGAAVTAAGTVAGTEPASGTADVDVADFAETLNGISTAFETRQSEMLRQTALAAVRTDYAKYFEAITKHPRFLVGQEVPSITGGNMETLRDTADAKDWQEATKQLLASEIDERVAKAADGLSDAFATVHASIDLFRNNNDMVPGTKQFDTELANAFATAAKDYEVRANGKLIGYSVPVQPIINALRTQIVAARAAATAVPAVPVVPAADQQRDDSGRFSGPQAGLSSKAGQSAGAEGDDAQGVMDAFYRQNGMVL